MLHLVERYAIQSKTQGILVFFAPHNAWPHKQLFKPFITSFGWEQKDFPLWPKPCDTLNSEF